MTLAALLRHLAFAGVLALLSALMVRLMIAVRVLDRPDPRKAHTVETPKGGGVGIVVAFLVGIAVLYRFAEFARLADPYFIGVIEASVAIAVVAFLDDVYDWKFTIKLAAQVVAALVAVGSGLYTAEYRVPYVGTVQIGWAAAPLTAVWLLFATNAMNFIDGLNGLAGGVALIASCFLAAIAAANGGWFAYFAALLLAAGLVGFLPFNFPRARIFMGDVGSQFCGFMLAVLGVAASRFASVELSFLIVPMLLSGVLFDVAFTLLRRALAGERVTEPHRGHLYQVAQRSGVPATAVTLVHWGFACAGGVCALAFLAAPSPAKPFIPLLTLLPQFCWIGYVARHARMAGLGRWG
jgi:UDP-GlcNAc:undecaprenyl-phosphate/decaprenyl-phosphate GlcNAc-1-phosphate transferase